MPATSADNSILATGRPVRIPTPDDPSGFPNYYRNFRLTTLGPSGLGHPAMHFRHDLERSFALGVIEDVGGNHQLVGAGPADEIIEAAPDRVRPADNGAGIRVMQYY